MENRNIVVTEDQKFNLEVTGAEAVLIHQTIGKNVPYNEAVSLMDKIIAAVTPISTEPTAVENPQ